MISIFKNSLINPFNIGDKFKMEVEITRIEKEKDQIMYVLKTTKLLNNSIIYGVICQDIIKMEKI